MGHLLLLLLLFVATPVLGHGIDPHAIPLGDGKVSAAPQSGYVYSCRTAFRGGGAKHTGSWIQGATWDETRKITVQGAVSWLDARFNVRAAGSRRVVAGNALPTSGATGTFPVRRSDPAFQIDHNPNAIRPQDVSIELPLEPQAAALPACVPMGPIGITLQGVLLFNALDDAGRDAVAHEVQDRCNGHPEHQGRYHYHGPSPCVPGIKETNTVIGFAFDGFPITGLIGADGREYTNSDLDECHGRVDIVQLDGKPVRTYHYAMTREYPYTVGCFRGAPARLESANGQSELQPLEPRGRPMPPSEAVLACDGLAQRAPCEFVSPRGDQIRGVCGEPVSGALACMPSGGPPRF